MLDVISENRKGRFSGGRLRSLSWPDVLEIQAYWVKYECFLHLS